MVEVEVSESRESLLSLADWLFDIESKKPPKDGALPGRVRAQELLMVSSCVVCTLHSIWASAPVKPTELSGSAASTLGSLRCGMLTVSALRSCGVDDCGVGLNSLGTTCGLDKVIESEVLCVDIGRGWAESRKSEENGMYISSAMAKGSDSYISLCVRRLFMKSWSRDGEALSEAGCACALLKALVEGSAASVNKGLAPIIIEGGSSSNMAAWALCCLKAMWRCSSSWTTTWLVIALHTSHPVRKRVSKAKLASTIAADVHHSAFCKPPSVNMFQTWDATWSRCC